MLFSGYLLFGWCWLLDFGLLLLALGGISFSVPQWVLGGLRVVFFNYDTSIATKHGYVQKLGDPSLNSTKASKYQRPTYKRARGCCSKRPDAAKCRFWITASFIGKTEERTVDQTSIFFSTKYTPNSRMQLGFSQSQPVQRTANDMLLKSLNTFWLGVYWSGSLSITVLLRSHSWRHMGLLPPSICKGRAWKPGFNPQVQHGPATTPPLQLRM